MKMLKSLVVKLCQGFSKSPKEAGVNNPLTSKELSGKTNPNVDHAIHRFLTPDYLENYIAFETYQLSEKTRQCVDCGCEASDIGCVDLNWWVWDNLIIGFGITVDRTSVKIPTELVCKVDDKLVELGYNTKVDFEQGRVYFTARSECVREDFSKVDGLKTPFEMVGFLVE